MERDQRRRCALVALTLVALPAAWVLEQLLARFVLPANLRLVQQYFAAPLRPVGWALVGTTALVGLLSTIAHRKARQMLRARGEEETSSARKRVGLFLWYASFPQIPALGATVGTLVGISLVHSLIAVALSTLAIAFIGARM